MELDNKEIAPGLTLGKARKIFSVVQTKENWKLPIHHAFLFPLNETDRSKVTESIIHFTGSVPEWHHNQKYNYWTVTAAGYYAAIGA